MADLGFLPVVRRLLDQTPADRSAAAVLGHAGLRRGRARPPVPARPGDARRRPGRERRPRRWTTTCSTFATTTASRCWSTSPRRPVVPSSSPAPSTGRKSLTRKLVAAGVPAVELHGNLAQNARDRNLSAFTAGTATTLVATDIAARGIHVDDVRIVIHADPPAEHKAYLHRSGRTGGPVPAAPSSRSAPTPSEPERP